MVKMNTFIWTGLLFFTMICYCVCTIKMTCPASVELGSSVIMSCVSVNPTMFLFLNPTKTPVATCEGSACVPNLKRFTVFHVSTNQTTLSLAETKIGDEGKWHCRADGEKGNCILNLYKIPHCRIISEQEQNQSLTVFVTNYYCSQGAKFTINARNTPIDVIRTLNIANTGISNETFETTFSVREVHVGRITTTFRCGNDTWEVQCDGNSELQQRLTKQGNAESTVIIASLAATVILFIIIGILAKKLLLPQCHQGTATVADAVVDDTKRGQVTVINIVVGGQ